MAHEAVLERETGMPAIPAYAAIAALGAALWWLSEFHLSLMPFWAPWDFSWPWYLAAILAVFWYVRGVGRMAVHERPAVWRRVLFFLGIGIIHFVLQTRFEYLAQHMFFLNRAQHVVMHHLGPFLIALAWPGGALRRGMPEWLVRICDARAVRSVLAVLQQPVLAAFLFVGLIALWLLPPVHLRAMIDPRIYSIMNWSMVVDGILFWCLVLDPRPSPPARCSFPVRIIAAVLVMFPQIAMGAMITFAGSDIYAFYAWCGRIYPSIGAIDDQQYGGLIVWIPPSMMSVVALLVIINMLRLHEERAEHEEEARGEGIVISAARWTGQ